MSPDCPIVFANDTMVQCIMSASLAAFPDSGSQTHDLVLAANGEPAACAVASGCRVGLQLPVDLKVKNVQPLLQAYRGNLTVLFEGNPSLPGETCWGCSNCKSNSLFAPENCASAQGSYQPG